MAKSYSEGYERGYADALAGRSKVNVGNFAAGVKNGINPLGSADQYVEGYAEGYRKGCQNREEKKSR